MAKKQTRRSVSIRGATYEQIRKHCEDSGRSMSEFVEEQISSFFDKGAPVARHVSPSPAPRPVATQAPATMPQRGRLHVRPVAPPRGRRKNGAAGLSFDEMQDAARHFTF